MRNAIEKVSKKENKSKTRRKNLEVTKGEGTVKKKRDPAIRRADKEFKQPIKPKEKKEQKSQNHVQLNSQPPESP